MKRAEKVLVAGATGYLGRYMVQEFKKRGYWVRVLARNPEKLAMPGSFLEPAVDHLIDEIFTGEITQPETLHGVCDDIDIVFTSVGITRQRDGLSFMEVDYQGNRNLLNIAMQASVKKFTFVSVFKADVIPHLAEARELFVQDLRNCGLDYAVIRPTGYFSDMSEYLKMAKSGRVYLFGTGQNRINPIHGKDLARECVDMACNTDNRVELNIGGPEILSHEEIGRLACETIGSRYKKWCIPVWIMRAVARMIRPFNKNGHQIASFFTTVMSNDFVAPPAGSHTLKQYFKERSSTC